MLLEQKQRLSRVATPILVGLAIFGVLIDPYTWNRTASDVLQFPPWWQVLLVVIDLGLLSVVLWWTLRSATRKAWRGLIAETTYHIAVSVVFVLRDGIDRFIWGFGADEIVSRYLLLIIVRMAALYLLFAAVEDRRSDDGLVQHREPIA